MRNGERRRPDQRAHDRVLVAGWALEGLTQQEIAARLAVVTGRPVSRQTVGNDLVAARAEWKAARVRDVGDLVDQELAMIAHVARAHWVGWNRSTEGAGDTSSSEDGAADTSPGGGRQRPAPPRPGDPRFLAGILACCNLRIRLLGLDAPREMDIHVGGTGIVTGPYERLAVDAAQVERVRDRFMEFFLHPGGNGAVPGEPSPRAALPAGGSECGRHDGDGHRR